MHPHVIPRDDPREHKYIYCSQHNTPSRKPRESRQGLENRLMDFHAPRGAPREHVSEKTKHVENLRPKQTQPSVPLEQKHVRNNLESLTIPHCGLLLHKQILFLFLKLSLINLA